MIIEAYDQQQQTKKRKENMRRLFTPDDLTENAKTVEGENAGKGNTEKEHPLLKRDGKLILTR